MVMDVYVRGINFSSFYDLFYWIVWYLLYFILFQQYFSYIFYSVLLVGGIGVSQENKQPASEG